MANKKPQKCAETKSRIFDSFWEIYSVKPLSMIKVKAVTDAAGFNRCTFYEYFGNLNDLMEQAENDLIDQMYIYLEKVAEKIDSTAVLEEAAWMYQKYGLQLDALLGSHGDPSFMERFKERIKPLFTKKLDIPKNNEACDVLAECVLSAMISAVAYWHRQGSAFPARQLAILLQSLLNMGVVKTAEVVKTL